MKIIIADKAGQGTDITARCLAQYAEKYVGKTIDIENVDGSDGAIGWSRLAEAAPDGMTIGFINLPDMFKAITPGGGFDASSFVPICNHVTETSVVIVRADDERFPDLNALVAYGRENQGIGNELIASTDGVQASNHIGAQAFANSAWFIYKDVPKDNTDEEISSLLGKEADFSVVKLADIAGQESEYKILGVFNPERLPELPDVPTLGELGYYPDWLGSSRCIAAPAGVSEDVVKFYEAAFKAAMEDPDYIAASASFTTDFKNADDTAKLIEQQKEFAEIFNEGFWYDY